MAATADLTLSEVAAKTTVSSVATYISAMSALPTGVGLSEFLAVFLQACAVAQVAKNAANSDASTAGNALNAYPLPTTGTVQTDTTNNIQFYTSTYGLNIVSDTTLNTSVPSYV
ncbi:MAG: hypothetical protein V7K76_26045 [Nostoc sp.]|uniref:hypothetical protein n=1 Tax=Nostoc sp. TaxID=1180 RepID=UPI002FFBC779